MSLYTRQTKQGRLLFSGAVNFTPAVLSFVTPIFPTPYTGILAQWLLDTIDVAVTLNVVLATGSKGTASTFECNIAQTTNNSILATDDNTCFAWYFGPLLSENVTLNTSFGQAQAINAQTNTAIQAAFPLAKTSYLNKTNNQGLSQYRDPMPIQDFASFALGINTAATLTGSIRIWGIA